MSRTDREIPLEPIAPVRVALERTPVAAPSCWDTHKPWPDCIPLPRQRGALAD